LNQNAKDEAAAVMQQLHGAESEVNALRSMTQRMILTQKEMVCHCIVVKEPFCCHLEIKYLVFYMFQEEVVLKRCWLARYWGLAAKYGNQGK
jgi:hypothetical protein